MSWDDGAIGTVLASHMRIPRAHIRSWEVEPILDIDIKLRNSRLDRSQDIGENLILVFYQIFIILN